MPKHCQFDILEKLGSAEFLAANFALKNITFTYMITMLNAFSTSLNTLSNIWYPRITSLSATTISVSKASFHFCKMFNQKFLVSLQL